MTFLIATAGAYAISRLAEQGFADFFGLKTLRHGTDPLSWVQMHIMGASPAQEMTGYANQANLKSKFILLGSTNDYQVTLPKIELKKQNIAFLPEFIVKLILDYQKKLLESQYTKIIWKGAVKIMPILERGPIFYVFKKTLMYSLATLQKCTATFNRLSNNKQSSTQKTLVIVASLLAGFTPTLKIRRCDLSNLENPTLTNIVLLSKEKISFYDIGLIGVIKNGLKNLYGIPPICKEPMLVLKGTVKLVLTASMVIAVGTMAPGFIAAHATAIVAGAIFGAL